jgi:hypothetical protein
MHLSANTISSRYSSPLDLPPLGVARPPEDHPPKCAGPCDVVWPPLGGHRLDRYLKAIRLRSLDCEFQSYQELRET